MITAKRIPQDPIRAAGQTIQQPDRYEFFVNETKTDVDGNEVLIPVSIGIMSLDELNNARLSHVSQIESIDEKIETINRL